MQILITGGTGFIGSALAKTLRKAGHEITIFSRTPQKVSYPFHAIQDFRQIPPGRVFDGVINLAGANIAHRWTDTYKEEIRSSRIQVTGKLVEWLFRQKQKPRFMISASAIGYYGSQDNKPLNEEASAHPEFTHDLCQAWEAEAMKAEALGVRVCIARLGIVLGKGGGPLKKMFLPFKCGLGGVIGSGEQMFSWVALQDVIRAMQWFMDNEQAKGIYNLTSPRAVSNKVFTKAFGEALNRPTFLPMPALVVKILFGEMGETLLLNGQNVIPERLEKEGFAFQYIDIQDALKQLFS